MTPHDFETLLLPTTSDRRLSASERDAIKAALASEPFDAAALRAKAFDLAGTLLSTDGDRQVLAWLDSVLKLVRPLTPSASQGSEAHFSPAGDCTGRICRLFADSRERADVCVFTITDDRVTESILAAHRRGVSLRVITDDDKSLDLGSDIQQLVSAGIPLRRDSTPSHMHHKFAIFDRKRLLNGSFNWTRGASRDNQENIIVAAEPGLLSAFQFEFDRLWNALA